MANPAHSGENPIHFDPIPFGLRPTNPVQNRVAVFSSAEIPSLFSKFEVLNGGDPSVIPYSSIARAAQAYDRFSTDTAFCVKHDRIAGVAMGPDVGVSLKYAMYTNEDAASSGVGVVHRPIDMSAVKRLVRTREKDGLVLAALAAPEFDQEALDTLRTQFKGLGLYEFGLNKDALEDPFTYKIVGGQIIRENKLPRANLDTFDVIDKQKNIIPDSRREAIEFTWNVAQVAPSNAVTLVSNVDEYLRTLYLGSHPFDRSIALQQTDSRVGNPAIHRSILATDGSIPTEQWWSFASNLILAGVNTIMYPRTDSSNNEAEIELFKIAKQVDANVTLIKADRALS